MLDRRTNSHVSHTECSYLLCEKDNYQDIAIHNKANERDNGKTYVEHIGRSLRSAAERTTTAATAAAGEEDRQESDESCRL